MRFLRRQKPTYKELERIVAEQQKRINTLEQQVLQLQEENTELKKLLNKDHPSTPATPSGMTPVYEKPNKKRRGKKPGRPDGHPGARRMTPTRIDREELHTLTHCPDCGGPLGEPVETRSRLIEDLPPVQTVVTRHVIPRYKCPACRKIVEPPVDAALPNAQIGVNLILWLAWMHFFMGVTIGQLQKWLSAFAAFDVSAGGLVAAWKRIARLLKPLYEQLGREARRSDVLHADETGWRVAGRTWWLWCFTSARLVFFVIARSRGSPVVARVLGKMFGGTLVCDFFGAYNLIAAAAKQRCLVHLFRELEKVLERNASAEWAAFAKKLKRLLRDAMRLSVRRENTPRAAFDAAKERFHLRLDVLCEETYRDKDCRRLVKRLSRCKDELFVFVDNPSVAADNNHAERQIRPAVIMRKNSYCNRSEQGAETQAIFMSLFRTLHLRNADAVETLSASIKSLLTSGSLLPLPVL